jgi:hypothetical protein
MYACKREPRGVNVHSTAIAAMQYTAVAPTAIVV